MDANRRQIAAGGLPDALGGQGPHGLPLDGALAGEPRLRQPHGLPRRRAVVLRRRPVERQRATRGRGGRVCDRSVRRCGAGHHPGTRHELAALPLSELAGAAHAIRRGATVGRASLLGKAVRHGRVDGPHRGRAADAAHVGVDAGRLLLRQRRRHDVRPRDVVGAQRVRRQLASARREAFGVGGSAHRTRGSSPRSQAELCRSVQAACALQLS